MGTLPGSMPWDRGNQTTTWLIRQLTVIQGSITASVTYQVVNSEQLQEDLSQVDIDGSRGLHDIQNKQF